MRSLYVLKDQYTYSIKEDIIYTCTEYQNYIKKLKEEEYTVIGYCRKSGSTTTVLPFFGHELCKGYCYLNNRKLLPEQFFFPDNRKLLPEHFYAPKQYFLPVNSTDLCQCILQEML
ncbi:unnamed protein product [Mucor circinelloides]